MENFCTSARFSNKGPLLKKMHSPRAIITEITEYTVIL